MNELVKRGFSAYKIFLKNKLVASIMMLFSGVMMFIAALQGKGNDVYSLPILITTLGTTLTLWSVYRLGYLKCNYDHAKNTEIEIKKREILFQILETLIYMVVAGLGVFLLSNQGFTNKVLNLMSGFFTTLNGIFNIFTIYKNRENKDFGWKFRIILMVFELILGPFFLINSDSIDIPGYVIMGALTTVAGIIEVISAVTRENLRGTVSDGREIVRIIKDGEIQKEDENKEVVEE
ncbi:MAG: DUF308 domain-containing protein [Candidatus Saccharibacteria bacterium]|nr:DUF308 domain-containing protein [Candidatus Saccharibacteria bacterium]